MVFKPNYALYYPTIEFHDYEWLWSAALIWDKIYRIVPRSYKLKEPRNVRVLCESGDIGIPIHPDNYVSDVADSFLGNLRAKGWDAAALSGIDQDSNGRYIKIHRDKLDARLMEELMSRNEKKAFEEWNYFTPEFAALYMNYLANSISAKNDLCLVSDNSDAWTASTYFKYDGEFAEYFHEDNTSQLAMLIISGFIPENITSIKPETILKFRELRKAERANLVNSLNNAAVQISNCKDFKIVKDLISDLQKDIETSLNDYRKSADILAVKSWTGMKSLAFPVLTNVINVILGSCGANSINQKVLSATGLALGAIFSLSEHRQQIRSLSRKSDYSYLIHLRELKQWSYCTYLYRQVEEFIND